MDMHFKPEITVCGLHMNNLSMEEVVQKIKTSVLSKEKTKIAFINADCVNIASKTQQYKDNVNNMDLALIDGAGIRIAGKLLHQPVKDNVNGTDLFPKLCQLLNEINGSIYLLGAKPGVADKVAEWIVRHCPAVKVKGVQHGYYPDADTQEVINRINAAKPDVLLVAMGAPKQEAWITQHMQALDVTVAMSVGGLFDFYSGNIPRAPYWMRKRGLEWVYRLYQEPGRMWQRYLIGNAVFLGRVLYEMISIKKSAKSI
jgi:N-acetylglucosaminyldiphosphoundecaprenol N-acetyl-beta-D-mannosaminyltransferase